MIIPLFKGLSVTFKHIFKRKFTVQYPEEKRKLPYRARWLHRLQRHEDGLERCVACMLCSSACPTGAIYIVGAQNTRENMVSHGERYALVWDLDLGRCIFCGYCVEACPEEAIVMTDSYELAKYDRKELVLHKEDLLTSTSEKPMWAWLGFYRKKIEEKSLKKPIEKHIAYEIYLKLKELRNNEQR